MPSFRAKATKQEFSEGIGDPGHPYPASYEEPREEFPFSSLNQIPYRGAEPHGVAFANRHPETGYEAHETFTPGEEQKATMATPYTDDGYITEPLPVHVVSTPPPPTLRRRFSTYSVPFFQGDAPKRIVSARPNRSNVIIRTKQLIGSGAGPDRLWVGNDEGVNVANGFPLDSGDELKTNTTDDIFASIDAAGTNGILVIVYTEFDIEATSEHQQTSKKTGK